MMVIVINKKKQHFKINRIITTKKILIYFKVQRVLIICINDS